MSNEHDRADERESVFLLATVRRVTGEQTVKVRNLSAGGALIEGLSDAVAGQAAQIGIRDHGWVNCSVAWTEGTRTGLRFSTRIDLPGAREQDGAASSLGGQSGAAPGDAASSTSSIQDFYVVKWLKGSQVLSEDRFEGLLEAKAHAVGRLPMQRIRRGVTAARVCDLDGVTYFEF